MATALIPTLAPTLAELVDRLDDAVRTPRSRLDARTSSGRRCARSSAVPGS
jgi:hypothetical protein